MSASGHDAHANMTSTLPKDPQQQQQQTLQQQQEQQQQPKKKVQPPIARVGKYLMLDLLGEGAFGKVRLAVDETSGKEFAIKIMEKSHIKANELTLQVRREIAVMKAMRHPNIVNLHEVLTSSKNLYMVMDLVTGGELFDAVAEHGRLPEARTRLYFQQLVDGIYYCHSRRVFHRDLKPENLLLSADGQTLKITDFGLSSIKAQNASSELLHTIMGSPHYIAPEIITSAAQGYEGSKVDVWASGVILFGMLAGFLPFDEPGTRALYKAIVYSPVQYPPHFSYDVIKLLRAMLQKDPIRRPTMEQIKTFPWFKVDYEPSVIPEQAKFATRRDSGKKTRHRAKRHSERHTTKQKPPQNKENTAPPTDNNATEGCGPVAIQQGSSPDFKPVSETNANPMSTLFSDSSRSRSPASSTSGTRQAHAISSNMSESTGDQENVDPRLIQRDSGNKSPWKLRECLSNKAPSLDVQPTARAKSSPKEVPRLMKQTSSTMLHAKSLGNSSNEPPLTTVVSCDAQLSATQEEYATVISQHRVDSEQPILQSSPRIGRHLFSSDSESIDNVKGDGPARLKDILQSPLTPQVDRFSSGNPDCVGSRPEARRQDPSLQDLLCFSTHSFGRKQTGACDILSPLSERSKSSLSSPATEKTMVPDMSPNYPSLVPLSFSSDASDGSLKKHGTLLRGANRKLGDELAQESRCTEAQTVPEREEKHASLQRQAFDARREGGEGIFRPAKSLFSSLAERASSQKSTPSISPSVLCPEFDYEEDGSPQWCIDSMEVFQDVEADTTSNLPRSEKKTLNFLQLLRNAKSPSKACSEKSRRDSETEKPKPIFAPLDNHLISQLSPTAMPNTSRSDVLSAARLIRPEL